MQVHGTKLRKCLRRGRWAEDAPVAVRGRRRSARMASTGDEISGVWGALPHFRSCSAMSGSGDAAAPATASASSPDTAGLLQGASRFLAIATSRAPLQAASRRFCFLCRRLHELVGDGGGAHPGGCPPRYVASRACARHRCCACGRRLEYHAQEAPCEVSHCGCRGSRGWQCLRQSSLAGNQ